MVFSFVFYKLKSGISQYHVVCLAFMHHCRSSTTLVVDYYICTEPIWNSKDLRVSKKEKKKEIFNISKVALTIMTKTSIFFLHQIQGEKNLTFIEVFFHNLAGCSVKTIFLDHNRLVFSLL